MPRSILLRWLILAGIAALLWLLTGWNVGFVGDDWQLYHDIDENWYGAPAVSGVSDSRPFAFVAYFMAYGLGGRSFWGANVMLWALLVLKSGLLDTLLRRFHFPSGLAFGVAALTLVTPIDRGAFFLGALNIQLAVVLFLGAFLSFIIWWESRRRSSVVLMIVCQFIVIGSYEALYPLMLLAPFTLLVFIPELRTRRQWIRPWVRAALMWYVVPFVGVIWFVLSYFNGQADYQHRLLDTTATAGNIVRTLISIYKRHFWDGWIMSSVAYGEVLLGVVTGGMVTASLLGFNRSDPQHFTRQIVRQRIVWAVLGLAIIGLSVAAFLPTRLRGESFRLYYLSAAGGVLAIVSLIDLIPNRMIRALLVGGAVNVGMVGMLVQHRAYLDYTGYQQRMVASILDNAPGLSDGMTAIVIDESIERDWATTFITASYLDYAVRFTSADYTIRAGFCYPNESEPFGALNERCVLTPDGVHIETRDGILIDVPLDHVILLNYTRDGGITP